jgi:hypothetical protein
MVYIIDNSISFGSGNEMLSEALPRQQLIFIEVRSFI